MEKSLTLYYPNDIIPLLKTCIIREMVITEGSLMQRTSQKVSMAVIRRLPKYYRYLENLLNKEIYRISSKELSRIIGFTASQIRQDLNCFGGFGQQGYGYNVEELYKEIGRS